MDSSRPPAERKTTGPAEWGHIVKGTDTGDGWLEVHQEKGANAGLTDADLQEAQEQLKGSVAKKKEAEVKLASVTAALATATENTSKTKDNHEKAQQMQVVKKRELEE